MYPTLHQSPREPLHRHQEQGDDKGAYSNDVIELYQELRDVSCQTSRLRQTLPEVIVIEKEQLQLLLIGQRKGIAESPEEEHH